jgi:hypothetical protein
MAVKAELALAMEKSVNRFLGDKLVQIKQNMGRHDKVEKSLD